MGNGKGGRKSEPGVSGWEDIPSPWVLSFMMMPFFGVAISIGQLNENLRKGPADSHVTLTMESPKPNYLEIAGCIVFLVVDAGGSTTYPESVLSEPDNSICEATWRGYFFRIPIPR